ncbi:MAG: glutathione S-transferase [Magnetovibrio sp.]|nr:glutathione S-transferase [Magnetovibrio sp.]|tara:strand:+ start:891 stop:1592 length:702 start_codon:yes stop_codon:yes gene_type:complete
MIDLFTWPTPNGNKVQIMLEEIECDYKVYPINIGKGEQFSKDFLKISPNNKVPAIVDQNGPDNLPHTIFESGAILLYLAEKHNCLLPVGTSGRFTAIQWLMFQIGSLGPMFGQAHHFRFYAPQKVSYAIQRYTREAGRLYNVLDRRLEENPFLAGPEYSIADIAAFPWVRLIERQGYLLDDFPQVKRWFLSINERPAVKRGFAVLAQKQRNPNAPITDEERENYFGSKQYNRR